MSKQTFEQLVDTFNKLMDELEKTKAVLNKETPVSDTYYNSEDCEQTETTPFPECDGNCESCDYSGDERIMTPLEELISNRITKHLEQGTFPSLEEAQAIHILDSINYRYNR